ncbi:hypothetical protein C1882_18200 [Pseudomonas sp. FW305-E2]|uniref:hypothetical protein n=1 Tax=Pseudomonas sp. FW305-E2 TaxID=2075558 RepID=UPI000B4F1802|nr:MULTISPECIES: hypothetical protein [Pseudomonas]POA83681.1 hypothetical protein C1882_18200 [Pseudomonas sp. FW305-E2]
MSLKSALGSAVKNFDPTNPFHQALQKHGESVYLRVIERATQHQHFAIVNGKPITDIAEAVRKKALEILADENIIKGMKLEDDLGI